MLLRLISVCSLLTVSCAVASDTTNQQERNQVRAFTEDLSFCYGENSICSISNDLFDQCIDFEKDFENLNPWYACICGNGYVTANEACHWCDWGYSLSDSTYAAEDIIDLKNACSSAGQSVAPLPTKAVAILSSFNATYTGNTKTATATYTGIAATGVVDDAPIITTGSKDSSVTKAASSTKLTATTSSGSSATDAALTHNGGSTFVQTLFGGGAPTETDLGSASTSTPASSSVSAGSGTSDSMRLGIDRTSVLWVVVLCIGVHIQVI